MVKNIIKEDIPLERVTVSRSEATELFTDRGEPYKTELINDLPADADRPLLVEHPYDDLYSLYVMAMIDFYNHEYDHYNNAVLMFTERLDQYKAWALRTGHTCTARNFRNIMG